MSRENRSPHRQAVAVALLVTFLWSSSWVLIRWGLDGEALEPVTFAALRYGLAASILVGWVLSRRSMRHSIAHLDRSSLLQIVVLGVVFYAVTQGAQFVAIDNQPAATTSLVLSWTPLLVAALGSRTISEEVTMRQVGGTLLVIAGASFFFAGGLGATAVGMTAALVGLAANVTSSLLGRHINRAADISPVVITTLSMAVGSMMLVAVGMGAEGMPSVSARAWAIIAWLAVVNTALAFTLWNYSLRRLSALESSVINNTMLIQIALLAWIFLSESPGVAGAAGIVLVSLGVLLSQAPRRRTALPMKNPPR
jgi:drug/metabolite transporter (DMT)-like permease